MTQAIVYKTDRNGNPILGPAKVVKVMGNRRRWSVFGYRANVSATVLERLISVDFTTKRDAIAFLREHGHALP